MNGRSFWSRLGRNSPEYSGESWHYFQLSIAKKPFPPKHFDLTYSVCPKPLFCELFTQHAEKCC